MQTPLNTLLALTAQIVAAHVRKTPVTPAALPPLIGRVYAALAGAAQAAPVADKPAPTPLPRRTVFPDYIICLEDGRKLKTLKRHLRTTYDLTPEAYREKWGLPADYPMVAPNYAEQRSTLAKKLGLGRREAASQVQAPAAAPPLRAEPAPPADPDLAPELTASEVFSRFPRAEPAVLDTAPEPAAAPGMRKRQPFANQRARTMRP